MNEPCLMDVFSTCYVVLSVYIVCPRGVEVFWRYLGDIRKMSQSLLSLKRERERQRDRLIYEIASTVCPEILLYLKKQFLDETRSWQVVSACISVNKLLLLSQKLNKQ